MNTFFVISVLGSRQANQSKLFCELFKTIKECGCNIEDSRMSGLASEFAFFALLSGNWDTIAKIEDQLPRLEKKLKVTISSRRAESLKVTTQMMPYMVEVVCTNRAGVVFDIADFFNSRDIDIEDMHTQSYETFHTKTEMFSLHMTISVPTQLSIASLRGEFMEFSDQHNIDSIMEPVK